MIGDLLHRRIHGSVESREAEGRRLDLVIFLELALGGVGLAPFRLRKPVTIPWGSLQLQFGCGYKNPRHFKRRFLKYLKSVISYYSEVRLRNADAGLMLWPSPTHVAPRPSPMKL